MAGRVNGGRDGTVRSRASAGAESTWGAGLERSILDAECLTGRWPGGWSCTQRIGRAWRDAGTAGQLACGVALALTVAVAAWWTTDTVAAPATSASVVVLVSAALVDVAEHRLPNGLVAVAALPVVVMLIAAGSGDLARSAAVGAVMFAGPLLLTHLVSPAGMGFGDVKAGAVLGAALGLIDPQVALLALVLGLASAAAWGLARRARSVAFGPGLVTGALLALAIGRAAGVEAVTW